MANGIDWYRAYHGTVNDPKFGLIARRAGTTIPNVLAVWQYLLERASMALVRGEFGSVDTDDVDYLFGFPEGGMTTASIIAQMEEKDMITPDGKIVKWEARQVKREREDTTSKERVARHRAKHKQETPGNTDVTPSNARDDQKKPREEERREEKKEPISESTTAVHLVPVDKRGSTPPPSFQEQVIQTLTQAEATRGKRFRCKPEDRELISSWESRGLTMAVVLTAYRAVVAKREADKDQTPVNVKLMNAFMPDDMKSSVRKTAAAADWSDTARGVEAKASELGMKPYHPETYGTYQHFLACVKNRAAEMAAAA